MKQFEKIGNDEFSQETYENLKKIFSFLNHANVGFLSGDLQPNLIHWINSQTKEKIELFDDGKINESQMIPQIFNFLKK